ncbi:bifunctional ADP-heptose synthase, partial [Alphaproteobacteria bacterium]|nr:bifunctional ADP-heptose synthase [Alphaproteobacteria bacterium]
GDTIIDQYIACDALGMSAEAPVVVLRELDQQDFLGGASIVAAHIAAMGANCHYISVVGNDENGENLGSRLDELGVSHDLIIDETRPTTYKIRYMVEHQKMFRVSRLKEHNLSAAIEGQIIDQLHKAAVTADGILISDFVYGCVTPKILDVVRQLAKEYDLKIFGDVQCSSQLGNVLKFQDFNLITPTEREARISLGNKDDGLEVLANALIAHTLTKNMVLKLGGEGFITYMNNSDGSISREHFPALVVNPIDVTGAGDSLLAALAVGLCSHANIMEAAAIGTCVASNSVTTIGNKPITLDKIFDLLRKI